MRLLVALIGVIGMAHAQSFTLRLRARTSDGREQFTSRTLAVQRTAVLICDMWDKHWCRGAVERVIPIAKKAQPMLELARRRGILIVHSPSETMDFYKEHPARLAMLRIPAISPPPDRELPDPPLPIDDKDGGCDTADTSYRAWTRQIDLIRIDPRDLISDNGREVYSALKGRGIENLLIMGVHTNMCVLNRSFAIKQMTRWGVPCILIRDLTDTMYNPKSKPFVPHDQGTELVVRYIETHWAPTTLSGEIMRALH